MTSSAERTSAEAEGYRIERSLMDCVAPASKGGRRNPSVSSSKFSVAKGDFRPARLLRLSVAFVLPVGACAQRPLPPLVFFDNVKDLIFFKGVS